jgi:hypothetical protein
MSEMLRAALDYAARGLPVFACINDPKSNKHKSPLTPHGFKDATTDEKQIRRWWTKWPNALIGIPTGKASGIVVVDLDVDPTKLPPKNGLALVPDWKTRTPVIARTGRGGVHLYFPDDGTIGNTTDKIAYGVDTRGEGGYVIVPPSFGYTWMNGSDFSKLPPYPDDLRPAKREAREHRASDAEVDAGRVAAAMAVIPNDGVTLGWDEWNRWGLAVWAATDGSYWGRQIFHTFSKKSSKYDHDNTDDRWDHYTASPPTKITDASIFYEASQIDPDWEIKWERRILGREPQKQNQAAQPKATAKPSAANFTARPFPWIDPKTIPRRQWLYWPAYIRQFLSQTVSSGGRGKSSLVTTEVLAMVSGKPLLNVKSEQPLRVYYWNGEDPYDELLRRFAAAIKHYGLTEADIGDRLFVDSGRNLEILIAEEIRGNADVDTVLRDSIINEIKAKKIDVLIIDPFVSVHSINENDNSGIERVAKAFSHIAESANCSVMLVHHTGKIAGDASDPGRGASAFAAAARDVRVLNTMTQTEANVANVDGSERRSYFSVTHGKVNMIRAPERADWFRLVSVDLENGVKTDFGEGDKVGVVTAWDYPKPRILNPTAADIRRIQREIETTGPYRADPRATDEPWVGVAIAKAMGCELNSEKRLIHALQKRGEGEGWLRREGGQGPDRKPRIYERAGGLAEAKSAPVEGTGAA